MREPLVKNMLSKFEHIGLNKQDLKEQGFTEDNTDIILFNNLRHYAEVLEEIRHTRTAQTSSQNTGGGWSGTETFQEALDLVLKPNQKAAHKVESEIERITTKIKNNLKKKGILTDYIVESYHYDVEGEEIDIAKLIEGDPNCYLKANKKYTGFYYDLHVNFAVNAGMSVDIIVEAYSKVIATVIGLERKGYKIRLVASGLFADSGPSADKKNIIISVPIKHYDTPISIDAIAKVLYPSFLRRLAFKVLEVNYDNRLASGYGHAVNNTKGVVTTDSSLTEDQILKGMLGDLYELDERDM
jgi:hypothetical protein